MLRHLSLKDFLKLVFSLALIISVPLTVYTVTTQNFETRKQAATQTISSARLSEQSYLQSREPPDRQFQRSEIGARSVYFHQRMVGEAIVEKDFVNYQFDKNNGQFLKKLDHWRADVPASLPTLKLTKQQAESMVSDQVQFSNLYLISPASDIFFPIQPIPQNPCWVISSLKNGFNKLTVIDAVTGKILGNGLPPPSQGFTLSGPIYFSPCEYAWRDSYMNAKKWFEKMGYSTTSFPWPNKTTISSYLKDPSAALFFEVAHGGYSSFSSGCISNTMAEVTSADDVKDWLKNRNNLSFAFIGSCGGMCSTDAGSFSYEFRKGSNINTTTVGYCGMGDSKCSQCFGYSSEWRNSLFDYMSKGDSVYAAYLQALSDYPVCGPPNDCMRFAGDIYYKVALLPPIPTPEPSQLPDFVISNIWTYSDRIFYVIKNTLKGFSNNISYASLYVDGQYKATSYSHILYSEERSPLNDFYTDDNSNYSWKCSGESDEIKVCADSNNSVKELNEDNNCRTEIFTCPIPTPTPTPSHTPTPTPAPSFKVFVTSTNFNGNFGGLSGADAKCQSLAQSAGLNGTFKAWLSDATTNAKDRFVNKNLPYYRIDGLKVAENFADLTDGTLANPIKVNEKGQTIYIHYNVWTNTDKSGLKRSWHCNNWTSTSASAAKGDARSISSVWTASSLLSNCVTTQSRLYCFEDR